MAQVITRRDGVAEGLAYKRPVDCATTANITLSGEQTIDGFATSGSRVLVKNQTTTTQNGIYVSATGAWTRSLDFDGSTDFLTGTQVYVINGSANGGSSFVCTASADPPVVGTSTITWSAGSAAIGAGSITNSKFANMADKTVKGNNSGGSAAPSDLSASNVLDMVGSTQGDLLYRAAGAWAVLAPGTNGQLLVSGGAGANPSWSAAAGTGTVTSVATGWGLTGGPVTTTGTASIATSNPPYGVDVPVNLQLNASVASSILTVAVKGNNGADPSATNPVLLPFRDVTLANGDPAWVSLTSALSISTFAIGATLGSTNGNPFRLWIVAFNNAGTAVLALINCSTTTQIFSLVPNTLQSTTAMSGSATAAGTFYTPNGTTLASKSFCILGYVDYGSGLTTAGTYATAPTTIQLFGPGMKKPGDVVQMLYQTTSSATSTTSSTFQATNTTKAITPTSSPNLILVQANGMVYAAASNDRAQARLVRGATAIGTQTSTLTTTGSTMGPCCLLAFDAPYTTSSTTYTVQVASNDNASTIYWGDSGVAFTATLILTELMG